MSRIPRQSPVLVVGRSGQVARRLVDSAGRQGIPLVALGRPQLDLEDAASVARAVETYRPGIVINAAAYTAVDEAEREPERAYAVNARGAAHVALAAAHAGIPLIHLSTDYVFDGRKAGAYVEADVPAPLSAYGRSKLAGEEAVLECHGASSLVIRTSWVFDSEGRNFLMTMLRLAAERGSLSIVADQHGTPTSARLIAETLLAVAADIDSQGLRQRVGLYHLTAAGEATWATFAEAIFGEAARYGLPTALVVPIATAEYPTPARRPANSRLSTDRFRNDFNVDLPDWREGVRLALAEIAAGERGRFKA